MPAGGVTARQVSLRRGLGGRHLQQGGHVDVEEGRAAASLAGVSPAPHPPTLSLEPPEGGCLFPLSPVEDASLRREAVRSPRRLNRSAPTKAIAPREVAPREVEMKPVVSSTPAAPVSIVGGWTCSACTMVNEATASKCSFCDTPRSKQTVTKVGEGVVADN